MRHAENHVIVASLYHNLFLAAIKSGAFSDAIEFLRKGLEVSQQHSSPEPKRSSSKESRRPPRRGNYELAAMLLGATEASPRDVFSIERELRIETEREARSSIGEPAYFELQAAGSLLGLAEASERAAAWLSDESAAAEFEA